MHSALRVLHVRLARFVLIRSSGSSGSPIFQPGISGLNYMLCFRLKLLKGKLNYDKLLFEDVYELGQYMRMSCPREIRQINALALGVDLLKIPLPLRGRGIIRINTQRACINLSNSLVTRHTHLLTYNFIMTGITISLKNFIRLRALIILLIS